MTLGTPFEKATQSKPDIRNSYNEALGAFECGYKSASYEELNALRDDVSAKGQKLLDSALFPDHAKQDVREEIATVTSAVVALTAHYQLGVLQDQIDALEEQMETMRLTAAARLKTMTQPAPG